MSKLKKIITNYRVIIAIAVVLLAAVTIYPTAHDGLAIRTVSKDSAAQNAGIKNPEPKIQPVKRERILEINNIPINTVAEYYDFVSELQPNQTIQIKTNQKLYRLTTKQLTNETTDYIGLTVYEAPKTNIRKGLDLEGGTRVLLQPEKEVPQDELSTLIDSMKQRLNIYGLTDVVVRQAGDLSGNQYILIEIAGANEEEVKELLAKQGKFEASIGNETVFRGGTDITYVCRSADCSGIDPTQGCRQFAEGWMCRFRFAISITPEAANKQADLTKDLEIVPSEGGEDYLSEKLILFLDDQQVDELNIGADLKGRPVTDIQISGSGTGRTQQEAVFNSLQNMKRLQTILITGSLPVKLNIVKTDSVSPILGDEFVKNAIMVAIIGTLSVSVIVFFRYQKITIAIPILLTMAVEVVLLLGIAALIRWNLDLAAIAGIIIAIGTGVDHQIIITDEVLRGEQQTYKWRERIKRAFFIIIAAYLTTCVAMIPLLFVGAGLLKGFALTTILGVSIGVFVSRPAYAAVIEILLKE